MKLLLTSGGLRNPTIVNALLELADKPAKELKGESIDIIGEGEYATF